MPAQRTVDRTRGETNQDQHVYEVRQCLWCLWSRHYRNLSVLDVKHSQGAAPRLLMTRPSCDGPQGLSMVSRPRTRYRRCLVYTGGHQLWVVTSIRLAHRVQRQPEGSSRVLARQSWLTVCPPAVVID